VKFRIHFTISGAEDSVVLEGCNEESIERQALEFLKQRGHTPESAEAWSEEIWSE
jgi:hypothetical protein